MPGRQAPSLKARALDLLARREHSREELRRKLAPRVEEGDDLEALLDDLARRGWLSEARFVEQTVRAKSRKFGPLKIAQHLREKGIDDEAIAAAIAAGEASQGETLAAVWRSRFGEPPADAASKDRQVRFLQARGFPLESILRFLRDASRG
jgi:regulatory protein